MQVTWSLGVADPTGLSLYRNGEPLTNPSVDVAAYQDTDLGPNTRYAYRLVVELQSGAEASDEDVAATLAYRPKTSDQMATTWTGLQQPIVDELNPDHTEYKITLTRADGLTAVSDWSTSKCRTFDDLRPSSLYRISVVARNLDGIETDPANQRAGEHGRDFFPPHVFTRRYPGTDDPWVRDRIRDTAMIYGLTDAAVEWMNNDILIEWRRGEPGWAGHLHGYVGIGHSWLGTLMHETMHAFWQFWDGFPEPCDRMNFYTFRRDVAQFALDFQEYDWSGSANPLGPWRPYYNVIVGLSAGEQLDGENIWDVLKRGEYGRLLGLNHQMETSIPGYNPHHLSLVPSSLRRYLKGFMKHGESRTWEQELDWYLRLADEDRGLWSPFITHEIVHHNPYLRPQFGPRTRIPEPLRSTLRRVDRQLLIDFINTLEDQAQWEWWDRDPGFWEFYVTRHIYRVSLYGTELEPSLGVDLEPANLNAVVEALQSLHDLHCVPGVHDCGYHGTYRGRSVSDVRRLIQSLEDLSDVQREVLLEMVDLRPN